MYCTVCKFLQHLAVTSQNHGTQQEWVSTELWDSFKKNLEHKYDTELQRFKIIYLNTWVFF